jgi:hypothetical protein
MTQHTIGALLLLVGAAFLWPAAAPWLCIGAGLWLVRRGLWDALCRVIATTWNDALPLVLTGLAMGAALYGLQLLWAWVFAPDRPYLSADRITIVV